MWNEYTTKRSAIAFFEEIRRKVRTVMVMTFVGFVQVFKDLYLRFEIEKND